MKKQSFDKRQTFLFDARQIQDYEEPQWELPNLTGEKRVSLDTETTGLKLWNGDIPIGISVATEDGKDSWYFPFAHNNGFNFEFENVKLWLKDNLSGKDIDLTNAKFDHNMLRHVGINLDDWGCKLHDIMHPPALLYPHRQDLDLDSLAKSELGKNKIHLDGDFVRFPMQERNSAAVAMYAKYDAALTAELARYYAPRIAREGLGRVLGVEDALIPAVAHMEFEGARIDVERLSVWSREIHARYIRILLRIYQLTGLRVEPNKAGSVAKLCHVLNIPYEETATGLPSITNEFLLKHKNVEPMRLIYEARQLQSIKSRAIDKFIKSLGSSDILRYVIHQLKASNEEGSNGAITGRCSSSGGGKEINGVNIQQIMDDEKQEKIASIADFLIRDLFLPSDGMYWLSADAMQIEFRLFAHYSQSDRLLRAYKEDPLVDFHDYVRDNIIKDKDFVRKIVKNINFSKIYGVGIKKLADMYLHCSYEEAKEKSQIYDNEFPEAKELLNFVSRLAEKRGFVKTILGRIHKFGPGIEERYYAALNYVIQGTAADIMKVKLLRLWETRKETGFNMRFTVHDECDGDVPDVESALKVKKILNEQDFEQLKVPILWTVSMGKTWKQVKDI